MKKTVNALSWVLIGLLLAGTLWAVLWAAKQPRVHSIWGEPSEKPLTRNHRQTQAGQLPGFMGFYVSREENDANRN